MRVRAKQTVKYGSRWYMIGDVLEVPDNDEVRMRIATGAVELVTEVPPEMTGLPDDLPYRTVFDGLGFDSLDAIRAVEDLTSLKGIGKKSAEAVLTYLGG